MSIKKLMEIAESATAGPWTAKVWESTSGDVRLTTSKINGEKGPILFESVTSGESAKLNAKHIATFNPAIVRLMLAEIEAGREFEDLCMEEWGEKYDKARAALDAALDRVHSTNERGEV